MSASRSAAMLAQAAAKERKSYIYSSVGRSIPRGTGSSMVANSPYTAGVAQPLQPAGGFPHSARGPAGGAQSSSSSRGRAASNPQQPLFPALPPSVVGAYGLPPGSHAEDSARGAGASPSSGSASPLPQEWLNNPRTQRMLQLLGIDQQQQSQEPLGAKHALSSQGTNYFQQLQQRAPHPPPSSASRPEEHKEDYSASYGGGAGSGPPSRSGGNGQRPQALNVDSQRASSKRFFRKGSASTPNAQHGGLQQPPPRSARGAPSPGSDIPPTMRASASQQAQHFAQMHQQSQDAGAADEFQQPPQPSPSPPLPPNRKLILEFLTSPFCGLFRPREQPPPLLPDPEAEEVLGADGEPLGPPPQPIQAPPSPRGTIHMSDDQLDTLVHMCGDAPAVVRQLKSLDRQLLRFRDAEDLLSGVESILARKNTMLNWMMSPLECRLFGRSPLVVFVVFLNMHALDRMVEESGVWKLARIGEDLARRKPGSALPPRAAPTQAYDDAFHILLKLNEAASSSSSHASSNGNHSFHYFTQLIVHMRQFVAGVLASQGIGMDGVPGAELSPRSARKPLPSGTARGGSWGARGGNTSGQGTARGGTGIKSPLRSQHPSARKLKSSPSSGPVNAAEEKSNSAAGDDEPAAASLSSPRGLASPGAKSPSKTTSKASAALALSRAHLKLSIESFLAADGCEIFEDFPLLLRVDREVRGGAEMDELVSALVELAQADLEANPPPTMSGEQREKGPKGREVAAAALASQIESHALSTLSYVQDSFMRFDSLADLALALSSGQIEGAEAWALQQQGQAAPGSPTGASAAAGARGVGAGQKKKTKLKSRPLVPKHVTTLPNRPPALAARDAEQRVLRAHLLAFLTAPSGQAGSELIHPKPSHASLSVALLQATLPPNSMRAVRTIASDRGRTHPRSFVSCADLLAYVRKGLAEGSFGRDAIWNEDEEQAAAAAVASFISSAECTLIAAAGEKVLPGAQALSTALRLVRESGAGPSSLSLLQEMQQEGLEVPSVEELINALSEKHAASLAAAADAASDAAAALEEAEREAAAAGAAEGDASAEAADESPALLIPLTPAQHALNVLRHAVWEFLHSSSSSSGGSRLVPPTHHWTVGEVETLVDSLRAGEQRESKQHALVMESLQREEERLRSDPRLLPHASPALLVSWLLSERLRLAREKLAAELGETLASIAHFLSRPDCTLLHGQQLFDEDIAELVGVGDGAGIEALQGSDEDNDEEDRIQGGGYDTLMYMWELHEAQRSFLSVPELKRALQRKRQDARQQDRAWGKVAQLKLRAAAATLFGNADRGAQAMAHVTLADIERMAFYSPPSPEADLIDAAADALAKEASEHNLLPASFAGMGTEAPLTKVHPSTVLAHLDMLITHCQTNHRQFDSFPEVLSALHAGLRAEELLKVHLFDALVHRQSLGGARRPFKRESMPITPRFIDELCLWSKAGHRVLGYVSMLIHPQREGQEQEPLFTHFHDLTYAVRQVHSTMRSRILRGEANFMWPEYSAFLPAKDSSPLAIHYPRVDPEAFENLDEAERRVGFARISARPQRHAEQRARRMDGVSRMQAARQNIHMWSEYEPCAHLAWERRERIDPPAWLEVINPEFAELCAQVAPLASPDSPLPRAEDQAGLSVSATHGPVHPSLHEAQQALPASEWWDPAESEKEREARAQARLEAARENKEPPTTDEADSVRLASSAPATSSNDAAVSAAPSSDAAPASAAAASSSSVAASVDSSASGEPQPTDSSSTAFTPPAELPPEDAEAAAVAKEKRRMKRATQVVDLSVVRHSGMLKPKSDASLPGRSPKAAPAREEVVASLGAFAEHNNPSAAMALTTAAAPAFSQSGPVAIAAADEAVAQTDAATKRRQKRSTQVVGGLADHVRAAAEAKKAAAARASGTPDTAAEASSSSSAANPVVPTLLRAASNTPLAIAALDSQVANQTADEKRKAKRSTQSVDPVLAAQLMNRTLATEPAQAVNNVNAEAHVGGPAPSVVAAATAPLAVTEAAPSSALAIASADEQTIQGMNDVETRHLRRATTITSDVRPLVNTTGSAAPSPAMTPFRGAAASPSRPISPPLSSRPTTGAVDVARADSLVNAMSSRERARSRRMTQALHDSSYDQETARVQRLADDHQDMLQIAKSKALASLDEGEGLSSSAPAVEPVSSPRLLAAATAGSSVEDASNPASGPASLLTWLSSPAFVAHRVADVGARMERERELDTESYPPERKNAALAGVEEAQPISYFVDSLGSIEVHPSAGLTLTAGAFPSALTLRNVSESGLCVFALASDAAVLIHTPTPAFLLPGATMSLSVSAAGTAAVAGAELGLVLKPLLPGEESVAEGAEALWHAMPHRIMQKVHVPLVIAPASIAAASAAAASSVTPAMQPHPPAEAADPNAPKRPTGRTGRASSAAAPSAAIAEAPQPSTETAAAPSEPAASASTSAPVDAASVVASVPANAPAASLAAGALSFVSSPTRPSAGIATGSSSASAVASTPGSVQALGAISTSSASATARVASPASPRARSALAVALAAVPGGEVASEEQLLAREAQLAAERAAQRAADLPDEFADRVQEEHMGPMV